MAPSFSAAKRALAFNPNIMKKIALVTGANKGIGFEIARQLGRDFGFTVLIGARDKSRGEEAVQTLQTEGLDAQFLSLCVTDSASIEAAARWVEEKFGSLDVLVNNAGISQGMEPPSVTSSDTFRAVYETNVFAPVAVTQAFLPLLRQSAVGRIVNMSSGLGSLTQQSDPSWQFYAVKPLAYNSSKSALNMATVCFAYELRDTPIKVNSADPGLTATDLNGHLGDRTAAQGATIAVRLATLPNDGPTGQFFDEEGTVAW